MTDKVAIIGGGVIGGGWAARFALNGWDVQIYDPDPDAGRKTKRILTNAKASLPGLTDVALPQAGHVTHCASIAEAAKSVELVIEAVPERLDLKRRVYAEIEMVNDSGLIASSTSGIMPSELQAGMARPDRLIVAHPFNPVYLLPLVELVAGEATDLIHIETAKHLFRGIGMFPLHCRVEIEGFLSDRLQEALWREALWLLHDEVATAQEIDAAIAYGPGLRWAQMGTMQTFHLAGGEGGMRAMLAMFGPCLKWPWTKLVDVPELTDDFVERVADQCDAQSGDLSADDLERQRDANLVGIIRSLKQSDWGAGSVAKAHDVLLSLQQNAPQTLPCPVQTARRIVPLDWTDYNGHMTEFRYLQAFADATDQFMKIIGCDATYIASGGSFFTAETHLRHLDEVHAGAQIEVKTQVISGGGKKMHLWHEMYEADRLLATSEHFLLHVSLKTRKPTDAAPHIDARLRAFAQAHSNMPTPDGLGRFVGAPR